MPRIKGCFHRKRQKGASFFLLGTAANHRGGWKGAKALGFATRCQPAPWATPSFPQAGCPAVGLGAGVNQEQLG